MNPDVVKSNQVDAKSFGLNTVYRQLALHAGRMRGYKAFRGNIFLKLNDHIPKSMIQMLGFGVGQHGCHEKADKQKYTHTGSIRLYS